MECKSRPALQRQTWYWVQLYRSGKRPGPGHRNRLVGLAGLQADRVGNPGLDTPTEVVLLEDSGALVTNPVLVATTAFVVLYIGVINSGCCEAIVISLPIEVLTVVPTVEGDFLDCCVLFVTSLSMDVLPDEF